MSRGAILPQELIRRKRDGGELEGHEIEWFVRGITDGGVSDAQVGAFAMAVVLKGMTRDERVALTGAMMRSGEVLDWSENEGHVFAQGERWQARSTEDFRPGDVVEVANIKDLTLVVRRQHALTGEGGAS